MFSSSLLSALDGLTQVLHSLFSELEWAVKAFPVSELFVTPPVHDQGAAPMPPDEIAVDESLAAAIKTAAAGEATFDSSSGEDLLLTKSTKGALFAWDGDAFTALKLIYGL